MYLLLKLGVKKKRKKILETGGATQGKWHSPDYQWKEIPEVQSGHFSKQLAHTGAGEQRTPKRNSIRWNW